MIGVGDLADEMLRAVTLAFGRSWVYDRLLEGGLDPGEGEALAPGLALGSVLAFFVLADVVRSGRAFGQVEVREVKKDKVTGRMKQVSVPMEDLPAEQVGASRPPSGPWRSLGGPRRPARSTLPRGGLTRGTSSSRWAAP